MKRMTKMEAVAELWNIKKSIEERIELIEASATKVDGEPIMSDYYRKTIDELKLGCRALEMAGTAMTR